MLGGDDIPVAGASLAGAHVFYAVNHHQAVEADPDPAEDAARLVLPGGATKAHPPAREDDTGDALPGDAAQLFAVERDGDRARLSGLDGIAVERKESGCHHATSVR